jgi:hypothetical protein
MKTLTKILGISALALASLSCSSKMFSDDDTKDYTMVRDGNYPGVIVHAYQNKPESYENKQANFEMLQNGSANTLSIQAWNTREAKKYGKQISIPLTLFQEDVKIPSKYIKDEEHPLDLEGFTEYLRDNYPKLKNYDFIAIYFEVTPRDGSSYGYARKDLAAFCLNEKLKFAPVGFAHEEKHLEDATDKYNEFDPKNKYDWRDVMKTVNYVLDDEVIVSEPTAIEIGWKDSRNLVRPNMTQGKSKQILPNNRQVFTNPSGRPAWE